MKKPKDPRVRQDLDDQWLDAEGNVVWPPNHGVTDHEEPDFLVPGETVERYGSELGTFACQSGSPYSSLSLPYEPARMPHHRYEVLQPLPYNKGLIAPWFDQMGGATQYRFLKSVETLISEGYLKRIL